MRVTFVLPHLTLSGGNIIALMYADRLAERGHDVTVLHGWMPRRRDRIIHRIFGRRQDITVSPRVRTILADSTDYDRLGESLPDADALVATWWHTVEACASAPPTKGRKFHLVQDHEIFAYLPERSAAVNRLPFHKIVVSNWLRDLMRDEYGITDSSLVMNPVDRKRFPWWIRRRGGRQRVGVVYSSATRKNCEMALEAVRIARKTLPELEFVCFSSEQLPKHWQAEFYHRPHEKVITRIYRSCDYWLFPSESEGFGLPILEAMSVGTPVIATPAGAAPDLVSEQTGALVSLSAGEMAAAIVKLYAEPGEAWEDMSRACRVVAERRDVEAAVSEFEAVLANRCDAHCIDLAVKPEPRRVLDRHEAYTPVG